MFNWMLVFHPTNFCANRCYALQRSALVELPVGDVFGIEAEVVTNNFET